MPQAAVEKNGGSWFGENRYPAMRLPNSVRRTFLRVVHLAVGHDPEIAPTRLTGIGEEKGDFKR